MSRDLKARMRPWRQSRRWETSMTAHGGAVAVFAHIDQERGGAYRWWLDDILGGTDAGSGEVLSLLKAKRACAAAFDAHVEKMTRAKGGAL